jgi:hypothetical protein
VLLRDGIESAPRVAGFTTSQADTLITARSDLDRCRDRSVPHSITTSFSPLKCRPSIVMLPKMDSSFPWSDSARVDARKGQSGRLGCSRNDLEVKWNYSKTV